MKAIDVTEPGFYWYADGSEWRIVEFFTRFGGAVFYFAGSDIPEDPATIGDGDFVGPLQPPA